MHHSVLYHTHTSPAPTEAPSKAPTKAPTEAPTRTEEPTESRRRLASEPDQYGSVVIYQYLLDTSHNGNNHNGWGNNPQYLTGTVSGAEFGEGVAISEDGTTVAVGSPGMNTVQVFRLLEGFWQQEGSDITEGSIGSNAEFGYRVGLSSDGNALAVAAPSAEGTSMVSNVGAIYVYDWDPSTNNWDEGMAVAYGTSAEQQLGRKGVAITIDSTNTLLHAVDQSNGRNSFEVCSFSFPCCIECAFLEYEFNDSVFINSLMELVVIQMLHLRLRLCLFNFNASA